MDARVVGVSDQVGGVAAVDDMGDGMQCSNHPYRNNPGGICAFCLQEKLGKLVSSSFPLPIRGSSSSSSSPPSFRSDAAAAAGGGVGVGVGHVSSNGGLVTSSAASLSLSLSVHPTSLTRTRNDNSNDRYYNTSRRARIPFLLAKKKKKIMVTSSSAASASASDRAADIVFKRSKSTTTPRRGHGHSHFLDAADNEDFSPRKRGFWSFLYHSSSSKKKVDKITTLATPNGSSSHVRSSLSTKNSNVVIEEEEDGDGDGDDEDDSPNSAATHQASASSFDRKVSRSRSVGCGSRSFSGDFFERISTGFGDCTLRRVESQREGKPKMPNNGNAASHHHHHHHHHMKERVKCGGIFGGFIMTSSSSSSSSSSYWVSSSSADHHDPVNGKSLAHGRSKSWGWAFASPMRAFGSKPSSKDGSKRPDHIIREAANKNTTPNLAAIPSLLAVRG